MTEIFVSSPAKCIYIFFLLQDFRTPKPAVLCSLRAKSWNIEVHKIGHSAGDNDNLSGASPISDGFQSQLGERVLILNEIGLQGDYIYIGLRDQGSMV